MLISQYPYPVSDLDPCEATTMMIGPVTWRLRITDMQRDICGTILVEYELLVMLDTHALLNVIVFVVFSSLTC